MISNQLIGSLTAAYTAAQVTAGEAPPLGTVYIDVANAKKYIFLKNVTATLEAMECACISDASAFKVTPNSTLNKQFAGVRVEDATDLADTECGWFQIGGNATMLAGDTCQAIVSGSGVVMDDDSDTGRIGGVVPSVSTGVVAADLTLALKSIEGVFGVAQESSTTTDAEVEVQLVYNVWGV